MSSEEIRACWLVSKAPQKIPALWKTKSKTGDCDRRTIGQSESNSWIECSLPKILEKVGLPSVGISEAAGWPT